MMVMIHPNATITATVLLAMPSTRLKMYPMLKPLCSVLLVHSMSRNMKALCRSRGIFTRRWTASDQAREHSLRPSHSRVLLYIYTMMRGEISFRGNHDAAEQNRPFIAMDATKPCTPFAQVSSRYAWYYDQMLLMKTRTEMDKQDSLRRQ